MVTRKFFHLCLAGGGRGAKLCVYLILLSFGLLHGMRWFETHVLGLPVGPIFKGQAGQEA